MRTLVLWVFLSCCVGAAMASNFTIASAEIMSTSALIYPPGSQELIRSMNNYADHFFFFQTYWRIFLCNADLTWKGGYGWNSPYYWSPYVDATMVIDGNVTNVDGTEYEFMGVYPIGESFVWVGTANFTFYKLYVEPWGLFKNTYDKYEVQFAHRTYPCGFSTCDDFREYPDAYLISFAVDAKEWIWMIVAEDSNSYRIYGVDVVDKNFKSGLAFRAAPLERENNWFDLSFRQILIEDGLKVFAFHGAFNLYYLFSHLPDGQEVDDPDWPGEKRPFTAFMYTGGAGNRKKVLPDSRVGEVVEIGATQILTKYNGSDPVLSMSSIKVFQLVGSWDNNELRDLTVDSCGYYGIAVDRYGFVYRIDLETMETEGNPVWSIKDGLSNPDFFAGRLLSFVRPTTQVLIQYAVNGYVLLNIQYCSSPAFNSCEVCVQDGGRFCQWHAGNHTCGASMVTRNLQVCPTLSGPVPPSVSSFGGTKVQIFSDFAPDLNYRCVFALVDDPGNVRSVVNATVINNRTAVECETPMMPDFPSVEDLGVLVTIRGVDDNAYTSDAVVVKYHNCTGALDVCLENDTLVDCGVCMKTGSCGVVAECPVTESWVPNGTPVSKILSLSPEAGPSDDDVQVVVTMSSFVKLYGSNSYECQWGNIPPVPDYGRVPGSVVGDRELECVAPKAVKGYYLPMVVYVNGEVFTFGAPAYFGHYDCADSAVKSCSTCTGVDRPACAWCPYEETCITFSTGACALGGATSCPSIELIGPSIIPGGISTPLTISVIDLPVLNSSFVLECLFSPLIGTPSRSVATFVSNNTIACDGPVVAAVTSIPTQILFENSSVIPHAYSFSAYHCGAASRCDECAPMGVLCGWCLQNVSCVFNSSCGGNLTWIRETAECPGILSIDPFQGTYDGNEAIDIGVRDLVQLPPSYEYGCRFSVPGTTHNVTVPGTVTSSFGFGQISPVEGTVRCLSPANFHTGFSLVEVVVNETIGYTSNSLSYITFDCEQYNGSCASCMSPPKATCGWCLAGNGCSANCPLGEKTTMCPKTLGTTRDTVEIGTGSAWIGFFFSEFPDPLVHEFSCVFGETESYAWTIPSEKKVSCAIPERTSPGSMALVVKYGDVPYSSAYSFHYVEPVKQKTIWGGNWAGILCTLAVTFSIFGVFRMGLSVVWGRRTPVIRSASPFFCQLMLIGGMTALFTTYAFIWKPNRGVCIARPWFACAAHVLIFGSLYAKTYRIYRVFHNPKLKRIRIRKRSLLFWIHLFASIDVLFLIVWSSADPMDAKWVRSGDFEVVRCQGNHTVVFEAILYSYKSLFVVIGCILAFLTRSVPSNFNESKYIGLSMYMSLLVALIGLPVVYFGGLPEEGRVIVLTLCILSLSAGTLSFVFLPKMWIIHIRKSKNVASTNKSTRFAANAKRKYAKKQKKGKKGMTAMMSSVTSDRNLLSTQSSYYTPPPLTTADGRVLCTTAASLGDRSAPRPSMGDDDDKAEGFYVASGEELDAESIANKYARFSMPDYLFPGGDEEKKEEDGPMEKTGEELLVREEPSMSGVPLLPQEPSEPAMVACTGADEEEAVAAAAENNDENPPVGENILTLNPE